MPTLQALPRDTPAERAPDGVAVDVDEGVSTHVGSLYGRGLDVEVFHILTSG